MVVHVVMDSCTDILLILELLPLSCLVLELIPMPLLLLCCYRYRYVMYDGSVQKVHGHKESNRVYFECICGCCIHTCLQHPLLDHRS